MKNQKTENLSRFTGCLMGLACGDAVGSTLEFATRYSYEHLTDMVGGGPFNLQPGGWTDDTAMALCLAASLVESGRFDPLDQMQRYARWLQEGYMSCNGTAFDIGNTTFDSIERFLKTGNPISGPTGKFTAGNGCIMRLAPVPMFHANHQQLAIEQSGVSSTTTHGATECVESSRLLGGMLWQALNGASKEEILLGHGVEKLTLPEMRDIAEGGYFTKKREEIISSGRASESLEAALWCFHTTSSFRDAILKAANLGDDADTVAAICGQVAGAYYGIDDIPAAWRKRLAKGEMIMGLAEGLYQASKNFGGN